ncbi:MAG: hypothetical protein HY080_12995 [Gammaproteobacteria bacterium]|nr:hypothetical protein [Gammaproteobacteria bacterium]
MTHDSNLICISTTPINKIPKESFDDFKHWVLADGLKPSVALRKLMEKYSCPNPDSSITIRLVEFAYPEIDISRNSFTFKIHGSGYPYIQEDINDDDFDKLIEEMRLLPPGI